MSSYEASASPPSGSSETPDGDSTDGEANQNFNAPRDYISNNPYVYSGGRRSANPDYDSENTEPDRFTSIPGNNNYRSGKIGSYNQLKLLKERHNIKTVINLAKDSLDGQGPDISFPINPPCTPKGIPIDPEIGGTPGPDCIPCEGRSKPCEPLWAEKLDLKYITIYLGSRGPSDSKWSEIKRELESGGTLIHCTHGVDRTGAIAARWRLEVDPSVTYEEALEYTKHFGGQWDNDGDPNKRLREFIEKSEKPSDVARKTSSSSSYGAQLGSFMEAIGSKESSYTRNEAAAEKSWTIANIDTGAFGRWQILPENGPRWAKQYNRQIRDCDGDSSLMCRELFGPGTEEISPISDWKKRENQTKIVQFKMTYYYDYFKNRTKWKGELVPDRDPDDIWYDVAVSWYAGKGRVGTPAATSTHKQVGKKSGVAYSSISGYANKVVSDYQDLLSENSSVNENLALVIGDSQVGGSLGEAIAENLRSKFSDVKVDFKNGSGPSLWYEESKLELYRAMPAVVFISLGGNNANGASTLVSKIRDISPQSRIYFSGPPPGAIDHPNYNSGNNSVENRSSRNETIRGAGAIFLDPFKYIVTDGKPGYYNSNYEDPDTRYGVHLPRTVAQHYVDQISGMVV